MCRNDVEPQAESKLADVLTAIRNALALECGADPEAVLIGPVDFGYDDGS